MMAAVAGRVRRAVLGVMLFGAVALAPVVRSEPAHAQEVGLVVYGPAGAPGTADEVRAALTRVAAREGIRGERRPLSRAAAMLASGAVRAERLDRFARIDQLAGEAWRGYLEARFAAAETGLGDALVQALTLVDLAGGLEQYADLSLRLGAVRLALGSQREAELAFRLAAQLDPERLVTDAEFKPQVVERYQQAQGTVRQRSMRRIEVAPAGAELELDGRAAGVAPLELELEEGLHLVVARSRGRAPVATLIAVEASGEQTTRLVLEIEPRAAAVATGAAGLRIGQGSERAAEMTEALMLFGELDGILLAASVWRAGRPALLGQFCAGVPLACGRVVAIGYSRPDRLERAAAELWSGVRPVRPGSSLTLLADARLVHREAGPYVTLGAGTRGPPQPWWRSGWLWLGIGGAALSAAAAVLVLDSGGTRGWTASIGQCEFGGC